MPLTKSPTGCANMTREQLEELISDLRRKLRRAQHIIASREHRRKEALERNLIVRIDGRPLQAARLAAGWFQGDIAAALGTTKNTVCHDETGKTRMPEHVARSIVKMFVDASLPPPNFVFASHPKATKKGAR